ncbi:hypothetical protein WK65_22535 [Burkholderia ubonensis]|nr:hypothetical protein WK65_22535 [Burkholderia ubonensis]
MEESWRLRGLEIAVPSFWQLSERFATLTVPVQQRGERLADRLANGEAISLIVNSTGMGRASEWHRQKSGRDASRTPWRKVHLSIDPDMNITRFRSPKLRCPPLACTPCWRLMRPSTA